MAYVLPGHFAHPSPDFYRKSKSSKFGIDFQLWGTPVSKRSNISQI